MQLDISLTSLKPRLHWSEIPSVSAFHRLLSNIGSGCQVQTIRNAGVRYTTDPPRSVFPLPKKTTFRTDKMLTNLNFLWVFALYRFMRQFMVRRSKTGLFLILGIYLFLSVKCNSGKTTIHKIMLYVKLMLTV